MRGQTLLKLLDQLRVEEGVSLQPASNLQASAVQVARLQRVQEWLWDDFAWPHLRIHRQTPVVIGERYYGLPDGLTLERLERIECFRDGAWFPLHPAIDGFDYSTWNSDLNQRAYPPRAWRITEHGNVEIWPISDTAQNTTTLDGTLRFTGIRKLKSFRDEADTADLDDRLIVLYAAAEKLQADGNKAATFKLNQAAQRYARLRGDLSKDTRFQMFGVGERPMPRRPFIGTYRPPI